MKGNYRNFTAEALVQEYQATQNEDILHELINRNKGVLYSWVTSYHIPNYDLDDLWEEAYIALWGAAKAYNPERGYLFVTCVKGFVTQRFNRLYTEKTRQKRFNGSEAVSWESLEEINKEGGYHDDHSGLELSEFLNTLNDTTKTVATMLSEGFTKIDVARALGVAPASVSYHIRRLQKEYSSYYAEV